MKTYISLFSSAGVGCFGLKEIGYTCVATSELLTERIGIQKANKKCKYPDGYISGDISKSENKNKLFKSVKSFKEREKIDDIDLIIATPPCQGMSVANHKKRDETKRNSLIIESLVATNKIKPKFFIFENVRAFLKSECTDIDGSNKSIGDAIDIHLARSYNISSKVINFKDYGSSSSRTRTVVIGVRNDIKNINPLDLFPAQQPPKTIKQVIGKMKPLFEMGEVDKSDIFHNFRPYKKHMRSWIKDIKEGESAFDNTEDKLKPHQIKDGLLVLNKNKNGDKYKRQRWEQVAPCIHTRNDILASQNTVHPKDDRVFSIRELMLFMTIPKEFRWDNLDLDDLNTLSDTEKTAFLKKNELNIRRCIGEAVPTAIFSQIATKVCMHG